MNKVGVIGLGNAGLALATAIARTFSVVGYDKDQARGGLAQSANIAVVDTAHKVCEQCSVIMLCLPNPAISREVLAQAEAESLRGKLVIENSTVGPEDIDALLGILKPAGARMVEAAILGGVRKLADGNGTFLVGAAQGDFDEAKPILESAAEKIFYLGPLGNGMRAKLVCNGVSHAVMVVLIEAATLAAAQGIPLETFYELMQRDSGLMRPLTHRIRERIFKQDFDAGMTIGNAHKDSGLILEVAKDLGIPLFAMSAAHTPYEIALAEAKRGGYEGKDYSIMSRLWEKWAGVSLVPRD